jgi:hypothetical protein
MRTFTALLALVACGCASPTPMATPSSSGDSTAASPRSSETAVTGDRTTPPASSAREGAAEEIAEGDTVRAGYVSFTGMITPVKDGYGVGGVVITEKLRDRIRELVDVLPKDPDWFLGAKVKLTGKVVAHDDDPRGPGGIVSQGHEGSWRSLDAIDSIALVAMPVVIEGQLARSKGLFAIDRYLVTKEDLAWSLIGSGGGKEGDRVRLFGQPRVVHCDPREQCLGGTGSGAGTIPLFDVGKAEKL